MTGGRRFITDEDGSSNVNQSIGNEFGTLNQTSYHTMVLDAAEPYFTAESIEEEPNAQAQNFYNMIRAADKPIYDGNTKHSQLSAVVRMLKIKCRHRCSQAWFDDMSEFLEELLPDQNLMPVNFYTTKNISRSMIEIFKKNWKPYAISLKSLTRDD